jgi:hypothetical protein
MQSVPVTTNIVSLNPVHGEMYLIEHYVIVCQWFEAGQWLSPDSSTNKADCHNITEILFKVALNTITPSILLLINL